MRCPLSFPGLLRPRDRLRSGGGVKLRSIGLRNGDLYNTDAELQRVVDMLELRT